jgi:hypothetical protein
VVRARWRLPVLAASLCAAVSDAAPARDLQALADFLSPAYTAMNFTAMCATDDPWFATRTTGPRGTALHYAEHAKDEAIHSLTEGEAIAVLRRAADVARLTARRKLHELAAAAGDDGTVRAVTDWCAGEGKQLIMQFIEQHDRDHAALDELLRRAKR